MSNTRYAYLVLIFSCLLIAVAAGLNILVDPYSIFGSPRITGINLQKPYTGDRGRTSKVHQVMRVRPRTLIMGNSRPEMGLDPASSCWSDDQQPVFNLAVPGLTLYKQVRYTQHALANAAVRQVFLGVDFADFIESGTRHDARLWPAPEESALRLSVDAFGQPRAQFSVDRFVDKFKASASLGALADSFSTIAMQKRKRVETRTALGFNPAEGLYIPIVNSEGVEALFTQKNHEIAMRLAPRQTLYNDGTKWSEEFEALDRLAQQTAAADIELVLYINPYHAEYLVLLNEAGLWSMFEQWKRAVVQIADKYDSVVWDFSVFDSHATELVSDVLPRGESLRWFWEPAHYRKELGSLMLSRMTANVCVAKADRGFGVALNDSNFDSVMAEIRARRDAFVSSQPATQSRLNNLISDQKSKIPQSHLSH